MTVSFNLVDRPWIPCRMRSPGPPRLLSLRDALAEAAEVQEIIDTSPLVTFTLHRLLLAVLHRTRGPASRAAWKALWRAGRFDPAVLDRYWTQWGHRFDLFDTARPFYQVPASGAAGMTRSPVTRLGHEYASGNNPALFDHSMDADPRPVPPEIAARLIVAHQAFALSGTAGGGRGSYLAAPLVGTLPVLLQGDSLFETLALNLVRYDPMAAEPMPGNANDCPAWERSAPVPRAVRSPDGYLDYLTWQSRGLRLEPDVAGRVAWVWYGFGEDMGGDTLLDPAVAYRRDPEKGLLPVRLWPGVAIWRDSHALIRALGTEEIPPRVCAFVAESINDGTLPSHLQYRLAVFGLCSDPRRVAKVNLWRQERLPLPLRYLTEEKLVAELRVGVMRARQIADALSRTCRELATHLLQFTKETAPDPKTVQALANSFPAPRQFWSRLEVPFRAFLLGLPNDAVAAREAWRAMLIAEARAAWASTVNGLDPTGRCLRAVAHASQEFHRGLARATPEEAVHGALAESR